jgi:hypothetical protein
MLVAKAYRKHLRLHAVKWALDEVQIESTAAPPIAAQIESSARPPPHSRASVGHDGTTSSAWTTTHAHAETLSAHRKDEVDAAVREAARQISSDTLPEAKRHFRDSRMQTEARRWAEQFNAHHPPCPEISYVPSVVLERCHPVPISSTLPQKVSVSPPTRSTITTAAAPSLHPQGPKLSSLLSQALDPAVTTTRTGTADADAECVDTFDARLLSSASRCRYFSLEPMLDVRRFIKHNNNNGFVRFDAESAPPAEKGEIGDGAKSPSYVENQPTRKQVMSPTSRCHPHPQDNGTIRDAAHAFLHHTYERSARRLMVCDVQGVGRWFTDPQIHTADGQAFGRGNLGAYGMYACMRAHRCNAVCRALHLTPLRPMQKKQRSHDIGGNGGVACARNAPPSVFSATSSSSETSLPRAYFNRAERDFSSSASGSRMLRREARLLRALARTEQAAQRIARAYNHGSGAAGASALHDVPSAVFAACHLQAMRFGF